MIFLTSSYSLVISPLPALEGFMDGRTDADGRMDGHALSSMLVPLTRPNIGRVCIKLCNKAMIDLQNT